MRKEILADGNLKNSFKVFWKSAFGLFVLDPIPVLELVSNLIYIFFWSNGSDLLDIIYFVT